MKAGRLIEVLKQVSPDTEVMCGVTVKDPSTLFYNKFVWFRKNTKVWGKICFDKT